MPLSNADNPSVEKPKAAAAKAAAPRTTPPEEPRLARASESGDAGVHNLLAARQGYAANEDAEAVRRVDDELAELGFAVY